MFFTCQLHAREWTTRPDVRGDRRAARAQLRDRPGDQAAAGQRRGLHPRPTATPTAGTTRCTTSPRSGATSSNHCDRAATTIRWRATRGAWTSTATTPSTRASTARGSARPASCTSDSYSGPSEASEPETKNDMWIADTYPNIKFASNMHSFGGYFMWSPGAYLDDGKRTTSPAPNIGVEKYFFEAGEKILGRIKELPRHGHHAGAHGPDRRRASTRAPAPRPTTTGTARASSATASRPAPTASCPPRRARSRSRRASSRRSARPPAAPTRAWPTRAATRRWSSPPATTA